MCATMPSIISAADRKGGVVRDEPMCHANEHDVRVRFQPVLFVLRRLMKTSL